VPIVPDDRAVLRESLEDQLVRADLVIIAAGCRSLRATP